MLVTHHPHMRLRAIPEAEMQETCPRTFAYLQRFRDLLIARPAFRRYFKQRGPFYSLFNIGEYTFAPWKVVWREQAFPFTAAVAGAFEERVVVPDHKLMLTPVESEEEAHYLCGALNSLPAAAAVAAYTVQIQIGTHVLEHIAIPRFEPGSAIHQRLAAASCEAHTAVRTNDAEGLAKAEVMVNRGAAQLWGLRAAELAEMARFLKEFAG
jgi:hypothetical protein